MHGEGGRGKEREVSGNETALTEAKWVNGAAGKVRVKTSLERVRTFT